MLIKKIKRLNSFKESPECQPFAAGTVVKGQAGRQPGKLSEPSGLSASLLKGITVLSLTLIISGCSGSNFWSDYTPSVNSRGTMTECVDKGLDESPLIECSSARVDEQVVFCDNKAKEQVGWFWRNLWHPVVLSPFRTEVHEAARVEQRCLENTGIAFDNAAW